MGNRRFTGSESHLRAITHLVNIGTHYGQRIDNAHDLALFLRVEGLIDETVTVSQEDYEEILKLRDRLRLLWKQDEADVVTLINALLRAGYARPILVQVDGAYRMVATPPLPLPKQIGATAAAAAAEVVMAGELDRMFQCSRPGCDGYVTDQSSNRNRRYCADACSTRYHVYTHRARRDGHTPVELADRRRTRTHERQGVS